MLKINKWNVFFVLAVCVTAIYYIIPNIYGKSEVTALPKFLSQKQVNLGLDLQGGSHLLLEVDTKSVLKVKYEDKNLRNKIGESNRVNGYKSFDISIHGESFLSRLQEIAN